MSTIIAKNLQIGHSNTPTDNFTLAVPNTQDGTVKLSRGNSGATTSDILTIDNSGNITTANSITASSFTGSGANLTNLPISGLGLNQTWQTPTRVSGTTYTNSTGNAILVAVRATNVNTGGASMTVVVGGVTVVSQSISSPINGTSQITAFFIVPNNTTYVVTISGNSTSWTELR